MSCARGTALRRCRELLALDPLFQRRVELGEVAGPRVDDLVRLGVVDVVEGVPQGVGLVGPLPLDRPYRRHAEERRLAHGQRGRIHPENVVDDREAGARLEVGAVPRVERADGDGAEVAPDAPDRYVQVPGPGDNR